MKLLQCDLWPTWFISSIPLLANSNTSSVGCTAVVMALGFSGSQLGLLLLPLSLSPHARTLGTPLHQTGVFFRALVVWSGRSELRERTRARFQKSSGRLVPRWSWGWVLWTSTPETEPQTERRGAGVRWAAARLEAFTLSLLTTSKNNTSSKTGLNPWG